METTDVNVTVTILKDRLVIQFKKVGYDIQLYNVQKWTPGTTRSRRRWTSHHSSALPSPNGKFPVGTVNKYIKNPTCICFEIGGSYYEICFD